MPDTISAGFPYDATGFRLHAPRAIRQGNELHVTNDGCPDYAIRAPY